MCKVMIIPEIKKEKVELAIPFVQLMAHKLTKYNNDGIGYAAVDEDGNLFGERWLDNSDVFLYEKQIDESLVRIAKKLPMMFSEPKREQVIMNSFGKVKASLSNIRAITLHTRMATTPKGIKNTHPFHYDQDDTSLIHNGVISNFQAFNLRYSTCDSEAILSGYLEEKVNLDMKNIQALADRLRGYYACGVFSRNKKQERILDVFRGNGANLEIVYVHNIDAYVMTTDANDAIDVCKTLGYSYDTTYKFKDETMLRFNISKGTVDMVEFKTSPRYESNYQGGSWKGYNPKNEPLPKSSGGMSSAMMEYMKNKSSIKNLTENEVLEQMFTKYSGEFNS